MNLYKKEDKLILSKSTAGETLLCAKCERTTLPSSVNLSVREGSVPPMKSALPNPHPEHMFDILWAQAEQSTETRLREREGER